MCFPMKLLQNVIYHIKLTNAGGWKVDLVIIVSQFIGRTVSRLTAQISMERFFASNQFEKEVADLSGGNDISRRKSNFK